MRRRIGQVLAGCLLAGGAWAAVASGGSSVNSTPSGGGSTGSSGGSSSSSAAPAAHVGSTINLKDESGNEMAVTLIKVDDPATGSDEFNQPDAGKRFVATQISIKNSSSTASISPNILAEGTLIDSANQSYNADFNTVSDCQAFASNLAIAPGDTAAGCMVFQVPTGNAPAKFQYTPSSGFSGNTGQWLIP